MVRMPERLACAAGDARVTPRRPPMMSATWTSGARRTARVRRRSSRRSGMDRAHDSSLVGRRPRDAPPGADVAVRRRKTMAPVARRRAGPRSRRRASSTGWTIGRRAGDHAAGSRRSPSAARAPRSARGSAPRAPEQPYVLDRDDRLGGEGLEELDLLAPRRAGPPAARITMAPSGTPSRRSGVARNVGPQQSRLRDARPRHRELRLGQRVQVRERGSSRRSTTARPATASRVTATDPRPQAATAAAARDLRHQLARRLPSSAER